MRSRRAEGVPDFQGDFHLKVEATQQAEWLPPLGGRSSPSGKPRPKYLKEYEIWAYSNDSTSNFLVLIDRQTGNIFLADYQV
jgi:hypothetical protein